MRRPGLKMKRRDRIRAIDRAAFFRTDKDNARLCARISRRSASRARHASVVSLVDEGVPELIR